MATVLDTLQKGTTFLEKRGIEDARLNMQHLIAHVLKCDRMQVYVDFDRELSDTEIGTLRDLTMRRSKGEPLQHLLGTVEFCGLEFKTDSRALVPRPETEELADRCRRLPLPSSPVRLLDVGCGSGVLGLTLAHHFFTRDGSVEAHLVDISPDALELAKENLTTIFPDGVTGVTIQSSDLFAEVDGEFDLIVANLPYIPESERTLLSQEVQHDPDLALYSGEDGLDAIRRFFEQVTPHLKIGGKVAIEYGIDQEEAIKTMAEDASLEKISIVSDLSQINRFLFAERI